MKTLFILTSVLSGASSFAAPIAGDQATYSVATTNQSGAATRSTLVEEVKAINQTNHTLTASLSTLVNGAVTHAESSTSPMSDVSYPTNDQIQNCAQMAGNGNTATIETITVAAGKFQCCHVSAKVEASNSSDFYLAVVPFGIVKANYKSENGSIAFELTSFIKK